MPPSRSGHDLKSIKDKIVAKRFDSALIDISQLLEDDPENVEALYMSAVCRRYTRDFDTALTQLEKLKSLAPEHGRAYQEEGHTYRDMGRFDDALAAYARACHANPALLASWRGQLQILHDRGIENKVAQTQIERLIAMPPPLVGVMDLIAQGRLLKAEEICREFLQKVPHHVEAMRLLADIGIKLGVLDDAELLLEGATKLAPYDTQIRIDFVRALRKRQKFKQALTEAKRLLEMDVDNPQFQSIYAIECMQSGDLEAAVEMFDQVLQRVPGDPVTLTSKGHAYRTRGDYELAVRSYCAAIESQPGYGEAWYALANLKVYSFADDEIEQMRAHATHNLSHMDRVYICFALGKAYEDKNVFSTSFEYYARGNALKKAQSRYDADQMSDDLRAQRETCDDKFFATHADGGVDRPDPIFIVGLPRAGSTLLEQILSSHSKVDGTLELPNILSLSQRLRRRSRQRDSRPYPENLAELTKIELRAFGEEYIRDTRIHRKNAPYFIDKMPNNFRHIGLIHLILPNAKIIDARRHPMACCFSGFKQLFAEGQEFTYDLEDLGRYYCDYVTLMDHWDAVLPGKVLRVQYEEVVADLEGQVARLLEFCGLPFEDACVEFHRTARSVRTPSSEQVRQPIYRSGLEQWRNFEAHLAPLKAALAPVLERYPTQ